VFWRWRLDTRSILLAIFPLHTSFFVGLPSISRFPPSDPGRPQFLSNRSCSGSDSQQDIPNVDFLAGVASKLCRIYSIVPHFSPLIPCCSFPIPNVKRGFFQEFSQLRHDFAIAIWISGFHRLPAASRIPASVYFVAVMCCCHLAVGMVALLSESYRRS
jgi:hypothetical protein